MIFLIEPREDSSIAMRQAQAGDRITLLYTTPAEQDDANVFSRLLQERVRALRKDVKVTVEQRRVDK